MNNNNNNDIPHISQQNKRKMDQINIELKKEKKNIYSSTSVAGLTIKKQRLLVDIADEVLPSKPIWANSLETNLQLIFKKIDDINKSVNDNIKSLNDKIDNNIKSLNDKIDNNIKSLNDKIDNNNKIVNNNIKSLNDKIDHHLRNTNNNLKNISDNINSNQKINYITTLKIINSLSKDFNKTSSEFRSIFKDIEDETNNLGEVCDVFPYNHGQLSELSEEKVRQLSKFYQSNFSIDFQRDALPQMIDKFYNWMTSSSTPVITKPTPVVYKNNPKNNPKNNNNL